MRHWLTRWLCLVVISWATSSALAMDSVPQSEYHQRRLALAASLQGGVAVLFAAEEPELDFMAFRQDSDFFYLSGWTEPGAALVIVSAGPEAIVARTGEHLPAHPYREILFLPERNHVTERYTGAKMDAATPGVASHTGFAEVMQLSTMPQILADFVGKDPVGRGRRIWLSPDQPQATATMAFLAAAMGRSDAPPPNDLRELTMHLRERKSPAEIELLRKASNASIAGQLAGMLAIRPGVRERTIAGVELERMMEEGCERPSYAAIVGSGPNSTVLHYASNDRTMAAGDTVVIDEAGEYSMYASDITRTMPVDGHFSARQLEIYNIVLGAQRAAAEAFVAGKYRLGNVNERRPEVTDTLDKIAYDYINSHGKDLHGGSLGQYFVHGLGHSVGIDVHDPMDYAHTRLDKGMVFTIEPGIYIPEEKLGVRIEDVFYVDETGKLVDFIAALPHEAAAVEQTMRQSARSQP